jgi:hypothetical protein
MAPVLAGLHLDAVSVGQHTGLAGGRVRPSPAHRQAARVGIQEGRVAGGDRLAEAGAGIQAHIEEQRGGGQALDRAVGRPPVGVSRLPAITFTLPPSIVCSGISSGWMSR